MNRNDKYLYEPMTASSIFTLINRSKSLRGMERADDGAIADDESMVTHN